MQTLRKTLLVSVMMMTVFSMSFFAAPKASAAAVAGDLIKMNGLSSVYFLAADGKRYVFPNESTYFSWYSDFSSVKTIPQAELEALPLGANVTVRPGNKLVKITTNPKVYAVKPNGKLLAIPDEATALTLYGANWAKRVIDVPDAFFTNYSIETGSVSATAYPAGQLVKLPTAADVYYIAADGKARKITSEAAFLANRFKWNDVVIAATTYVLPALGTDLAAADSTITDTSSGAGGTIGAGTGATLALASGTPGSATVPSNATGVVFTKFNVTASNDGPVTLNSITTHRSGVGATSDISKVYLYDGDNRLTNGKSVNASTNDSDFTNLGLVIAAGQTKTLSIVADIANNVNGNHAFGIESASMVSTNGAAVSGSFPIRGNTMSLSTQTVGKTDVDSSGTGYTRKVGEKDVEVANFAVYVNSTEDATFKGISLYWNGRDVITNMMMYRGSTKVATGVKNGSYWVFTLDTPFDIAKGESASFAVRGDVTGRNADTETLDVRYSTDVKVVGKTYGYNLGIDKSLGTADQSYIEDSGAGTLKSNLTTLQAGQLTLSVNGPAAGDVSKNTNDVVLMNFAVTAASAVDVSKFSVSLTDSTNLLNIPVDLNDLELQCKTGNNFASMAVLNAVATGTNIFTDTWTIPSGTTDCRILVDIANTANGASAVKATVLDLTSGSNATIKDSNNDTVTDIVPSGNIAGNEMNIVAASLTVALASTPAVNQTYVKGQSDAAIAGFVFTAGNASDVKVTSMKITSYRSSTTTFLAAEKGADSGANNDMVSIKLYDGATLIATKSLTKGSSDITSTFDGLSLSIPAGQQKTITVKANISTALATNAYVAIAFAGVGDVTAEYGSGTNIAATMSGNAVNTTPTIYQLLTAGGTLTASTDADTPVADLIVMGTTGVNFTKVKFTSTNEAYIVDKLRVSNTGSGDAQFTGVTLEYKDSANVTQSATQSLSGGVADFTGLTFYVPKDDSAVITIKGNMNTSTGGATASTTAALGLVRTGSFVRALGQASGATKTTISTTDQVGNTMIIFKSKPTFAFNASTPSGVLIPSGNTLVGIINVTADAGADIQFASTSSNSIKVSVGGSIAAGSSSAASVTWTLKDQDGNTLDTVSAVTIPAGGVTFDFTNRQFTVAKGTTKQLKVYTDTTNLGVDGNSIQIYLDDANSANVGWGVTGTDNYHHANILFRGQLFGGSLVK
jgi:hypothetical protein